MTGPIDVLIVEDDVPNAEYVRTLLTSKGYRARVAETLAKARGMVATREPNNIILDLRLPDGDGETLIPYIRRDRPGARIIIVSGDSEAKHITGADVVHVKGRLTSADLFDALTEPRARPPDALP